MQGKSDPVPVPPAATIRAVPTHVECRRNDSGTFTVTFGDFAESVVVFGTARSLIEWWGQIGQKLVAAIASGVPDDAS